MELLARAIPLLCILAACGPVDDAAEYVGEVATHVPGIASFSSTTAEGETDEVFAPCRDGSRVINGACACQNKGFYGWKDLIDFNRNGWICGCSGGVTTAIAMCAE